MFVVQARSIIFTAHIHTQTPPYMRALIQRVQFSKVVVEDKTVGEIGPGLMVLLGVTHEDNQTDIDWLVKKISKLRIFNDENGEDEPLRRGHRRRYTGDFSVYAFC